MAATLRNPVRFTTLLAGAVLTVSCTSGNAGKTVPLTSQKIAATLQFAVGSADIGYAGGNVTGLNTVVTFRNNSTGHDASLVNTPVITGPTGFVVLPEPNNSDAGTAHISGDPQTAQNPTATFGTSGGAFAYGFEPDNSDTTGSANFNTYGLPFYAAQIPDATFAPVHFVGGPPAFPSVTTGQYPSGFPGFTQGFTDFVAAPVSGTYRLTVTVPAAQQTLVQTFTARATLSTTTPLAAVAAPVFTEDGRGGGTLGVTLPTGLTEAAAYVNDTTAGAFFTLALPGAAGPHSVTLADNLGASAGGAVGPTLPSGDAYIVTVVGFDYPALEASAPANVSPHPTITSAGGLADITVSPTLSAVYGTPGSATILRHHAGRR